MPNRSPHARKLTEVAVAKLKAPASGRVIYWDVFLPSFGVRITSNNARSWIVCYRIDGRAIMETIGPVHRLPNVEEARKRARASMEKAATGVNPVAEHRAQKRQRITRAKDAATRTFEHIVKQYLRDHVAAKQHWRTARETQRRFDNDILPRWRDRDVASIQQGEVQELYAETQRHRGPSSANALIGVLKALYNWLKKQHALHIDRNPTDGITLTKEEPRDRELADSEVVGFWQACDKINDPIHSALFRLLLLTAQRKGEEVGKMEWAEIDFDNGLWEIPKEWTKNKKPHIVPLSPLALAVIESIPRIGNGQFVFTTNGQRPVNNWNDKKRALDKHHAFAEPWTLHDLRRTAATGMSKLRVAPHVVEHIL